METRTSTTNRRGRAGRTAAARVLVAWLSLLSLLSFLGPMGPAPAQAMGFPSTAACDASERPTALDRRIEPLRVPAVRPSRDPDGRAPGLREAAAQPPPPARLAAWPRRADVPRHDSRLDASIPSARARAERMVFLI